MQVPLLGACTRPLSSIRAQGKAQSLTGADELRYEIRLPPADLARVARVRATLYSQSIPPFYLQQRFADAKAEPAQSNEIQRLYYLTSHLNTGRGRGSRAGSCRW